MNHTMCGSKTKPKKGAFPSDHSFEVTSAFSNMWETKTNLPYRNRMRKFEFLSLHFRCINWGKRCDPEAKCGRNVRWMRRRQRKTLNTSNSYSRSLKGKAQTIHLDYKHVFKFIIIKLTDCLMKWSSRSKAHWVVHNLPRAPKAMSSWNSSDMQLSTWREPKSVRQPTLKRLFNIS